MGLILILYIMAGLALGLLLASVACGIGALLIILRNSKARANVWPLAVAGAAVGLLLAGTAIQFIPQQQVRPGSDYDKAAQNLFVNTLGYSLAPAAGAVAAAIATFSCRIVVTPRLATRLESTPIRCQADAADKPTGGDQNRTDSRRAA